MNDFSIKFPPEVLAFYDAKKPQIGGLVIAERARLRAEMDFKEILPWLPGSVVNYVNIGSGIGVLDVFMIRNFDPAEATLVEGSDAPSAKSVGFHERLEPWTFLEHIRSFMRTNLTEKQYRAWSYAEPNKPFPHPMDKRIEPSDLVISLRSWCHHYPVSTYLKSVKKCLSSGGILIVDIRKDTDGRKQLERDFKFVGIIGGSAKRDRMVFTA